MTSAAGKGLVCTILAAGGAALAGAGSEAVGNLSLAAATLSTMMGGAAGNMAREIIAEHSDAVLSAILRRRPGIDASHHILLALRQSHLKALEHILIAYDSSWTGDFDTDRRREAKRFSTEVRRFLNAAGLGNATGAGPATELETAVFRCLPESFNAALAAGGPSGRDAPRNEATEARAALEALVMDELAVGAGTTAREIPPAFRSLLVRDEEGWFNLFVRDAAAGLRGNAAFRHIWTAEQLARIESNDRAILGRLDDQAAAIARMEERDEERRREAEQHHAEALAAIHREKGVDPEQLRPVLERLGHTDIHFADIPRVLNDAVDQLLARGSLPVEPHNDGAVIDAAIATARRRLLENADISGALAAIDAALEDDEAWKRALEREAEAKAQREALARGRARGFFEKAVIQRITFDHEGACDSLREGLELDGSDILRWIDLGDELILCGRTADALLAFENGRERGDAEAEIRQQELAALHSRIGGVRQDQGDLERALESYKAEKAIINRLVANNPENVAWQRVLAIVHGRIGDVQRAQGALTNALKSFDASRSSLIRIYEADPSDVLWQQDLAVVYGRTGGIRCEMGDLAAALECFEAAMVIFSRIAEANPGNMGVQRELAVVHSQIGSVLRDMGDLSGALKNLEMDLSIMSRLAEADVENAVHQRELAISHGQIGQIKRDLGDTLGARESLAAAIGITLQLSEADPFNSAWQRELARAYRELGNLQLQDMGEISKALQSYDADVSIMRKLVESNPSNPVFRHDLALANGRKGEGLLCNRELASAAASFRAAILILSRLVDDDTSNAGWRRELAILNGQFGEVMMAQGDLAAALVSFDISRNSLSDLCAVDPSNTIWQRDLAAAHGRTGSVRRDTGDFGGALECFKAELDILARLMPTHTTNVWWHLSFAEVHIKIGYVLRAMGDLDSALEHYFEAKKYLNIKIVDVSDNILLIRRLSSACDSIGNIFKIKGETSNALAIYKEARDIIRPFAEASTAPPQLQRDLSNLHLEIGALLQGLGDRAGSVESFGCGMAIIARLDQAPH